MKKWLPLTEAQAWDELTELWLEGKNWGGIDLCTVLKGRQIEEIKEFVRYVTANQRDKAMNELAAFCDEFLSKNPKLIQAYIQEKNDENAEDESHLDDPRRGQAEGINERRYLVAEAT